MDDLVITTAELSEYTDEQLAALGLDRRMSITYLPGMTEPDMPYDPVFDTSIDPRMVKTGWLSDPRVEMDMMALDLDAFAYEDIDESPQYWRDLIGRDLRVAEQIWLGEFKRIQENRQNFGSPGIPEKGQPCI